MKDQNIIGGHAPVKIYNSLSGKKEVLRSLEGGKIAIYVCGMTVYDHCHIGHARVLVVFDSVVRYLRSIGISVNYVRNITDIDDKIIARSNEIHNTIDQLTERFINAMHEDELLLNVIPPDEEPKATDFISEIIELIAQIRKSGYAYQGIDGDIYFRVRKFNGYGKLSKRSLDQLESGARVEINDAKEDPLDFVLWKARKPGEPYWEAPWGPGRPGWHIECSAMSMSCLGQSFDIHGGGMDLKFPHHENEIAQSEVVTGRKFVNYWMHNGYVQIQKEKMSKSLGNFLTIREILLRDRNPQRMGEIIRFMILSSHYRSPLSFSDSGLAAAKASLTRLYRVLDKISADKIKSNFPATSEHCSLFNLAMADDFNTAEAISILFDLAREVNRLIDVGARQQARVSCGHLLSMGAILGLLYQEPNEFLSGLDDSKEILHPREFDWVDKKIDERLLARREENWIRADQIRDELRHKGVVLEDRADEKTVWRME